ncbi:biotin synthase BioB, partial [Streptomyces sp. NPDC096080]
GDGGADADAVCGTVPVTASGEAGTGAAVPASGKVPGEARTDLVAVRRRGAGTDIAPNA